jgi:hypothetical protein
MRERERWEVTGIERGAGVRIERGKESLMTPETRGEDEVMADIGMEGIRIEMMIGEVEEVIIIDGDDGSSLGDWRLWNFLAVFLAFVTFRQNDIKKELIKAILFYSYKANMKWRWQIL